MSETDTTKSPWKASQMYSDGMEVEIITGADGKWVCEINGWGTKPEDRALILAAPEMYHELCVYCMLCTRKKVLCVECTVGKALRKARGDFNNAM